MHGKRLRSDTGTDDPFPDIGGLYPSASLVRHRSERLIFAFPQNGATPAKFTADIFCRQTDQFEPRHGEMPAVPPHPEAPVARRARHVMIRRPIVANLVDETGPQPNRIRKIDAGDCTGSIRLSPDPVSRKGKRGIGKTCSPPAAEFVRITALRRGVLRVELSSHVTIDITWQSSLQRAARQKNIVAFLDGRRRQKHLTQSGND